MSRSQNLRQNVINQMLEAIARRYVRSPLPHRRRWPMFNISRTTVRHTLHLHQRGVLEKVAETYVIVRDPARRMGLAYSAHRSTNRRCSLSRRF